MYRPGLLALVPDADAGGNSLHSGRPKGTELASVFRPHPRRAVITDALQPA
jgi:hypothetical protein